MYTACTWSRQYNYSLHCSSLPALFQHFKHVVPECIPVLLQQSDDIVEHVTSIVTNAKLGMVDFGLKVKWITLQETKQYNLMGKEVFSLVI